MKISCSCWLVFVCSVFYYSLGFTQSIVDPNNINVHSSNAASTSIENTTNREVLESDSVINSGESDLQPSSDATQEAVTGDENLYTTQHEFLDVAQNSGVAHEVTTPSLEIIHTLVDSPTLELQDKADELSVAATISDTSQYNSSSNIEDNSVQETDLDKEVFKPVNSHQDNELVESDNVNQTEDIPHKVPSTEPKINITDKNEEIPSFSEWTQKQLEEAERKREEVNASVQNQFPNGKTSLSGKKRWKNYASPDCGAKIVAANPEAVSRDSILSSSRDEYKLNTCHSRIWFVVELCEAIQAKKIELANFELFSSSPKDFTISISDRLTTRDWSSVGVFNAKDNRDIQSFDLDPHLFGKYIKFEMHSHHGSEHYCPISLFRVYGTSEFEVLETENQVNVADDDDDDEALDSNDGDPPKNLFSSATDAVISIVRKAAEALGNKGNRSKTEEHSINKTSQQYIPLVNSCTTPSHIVVCENCTDLLFGYVYELLSCKSKELGMLIKIPFIRKTIYNSNICSLFGLNWRTKPNPSLPDMYKNYLLAFFAPQYIAALCNTVAITECKTVLNVSRNATIAPQNIENLVSSKSTEIVPNIIPEVTTEAIAPASTVLLSTTTDIPITTQIKPTKTLTPEENLNADSSESIHKGSVVMETAREALVNGRSDDVALVNEEHSVLHESGAIELNTSDIEPVLEILETEDPLETLVSEITEDSTPSVPVTTATPPSQPQQQQKETVFLRLSNRLKALELNMSLSGQYLEELSRRYKKQVEEMQRLLDKTILTLNEDNKKKEERAEHLEQQIYSLKQTVETLIQERNSWVNVVYWIIFIVTVTCTVLFCKRNNDSKQPTTETNIKNSESQRRKSIAVVTHKSPKRKKRRPSEEALLINGTYKELMINDVAPETALKDKKKKRRKPVLFKSNSVKSAKDELVGDKVISTADGSTEFDFAPQLTSSRILKHDPPLERVDKSTYVIQDIPFVLEESEYSSLEPLTHDLLPNSENVKTTNQLSNSNSKANHHKHKKSASLDNSKSSGGISPNDYEPSLNGSLPDELLVELPRREKRNFFKKIFKNFSSK